MAGCHGSSRRGARGQGGGCHALGGRGRSSADQSCYSSSASPRRAPRIGFHLLIRCFPHSIPTHPSPSLSYPLLSSPFSLPPLPLSLPLSLSSSLPHSLPPTLFSHIRMIGCTSQVIFFTKTDALLVCVCVRACVRLCWCVCVTLRVTCNL